MPYYAMNLKDRQKITFTTDDYQLITDNHFIKDHIIYEFQKVEKDGSYKSFRVGKINRQTWDKIRSNANGNDDSYVIEIFLGIIEKRTESMLKNSFKPVKKMLSDGNYISIVPSIGFTYDTLVFRYSTADGDIVFHFDTKYIDIVLPKFDNCGTVFDVGTVVSAVAFYSYKDR